MILFLSFTHPNSDKLHDGDNDNDNKLSVGTAETTENKSFVFIALIDLSQKCVRRARKKRQKVMDLCLYALNVSVKGYKKNIKFFGPFFFPYKTSLEDFFKFI